MSEQISFPRWVPLLGGLLGSTTCGLLIYAFSVFIRPLQAEFGWTVPQIALAYALICLVQGLITLPAGRLSDRFGPRNVVLVGGVIMSFGFYMVSTITPPPKEIVAAALAPDASEAAVAALKAANRTPLYLLYLYYGVIAGIGCGCVYLPPIATAPKWWPDHRALATGFTVVGLGLGSFIMAPLATSLIEHFGGSALPVFKYVGIVMAIMAIGAAFCLKVPPTGWKPAGWEPSAPADGASAASYRDYTHEESKKTPQFWLLWTAYFCGAFAGLMVIGLIAKHGIDSMSLAFKARHALDSVAMIPADEVQKFAMAAAYALSALAIFNALVRIVIGLLVDKIGTREIFVTLFACQVVAMILLFPAGKSAILLAACAAFIGWNYGAMFTLFPATTLQYFGASAQASNYGLLFTAFGVAGFAGPFIGAQLQAMTGSFLVPFVVSAAVLAVATFILATMKAPEKKLA